MARRRGWSINRGCGSARLDRVRPFYEFARDELGEIFRRAAFRRRDVQSQALQAFAHPRQVERVACDLGEAAHDRLGRTAGQEESVPAIGVETREALLLGGREVRQNAAALGREQRDGLHGLVANERERSRNHVTDVVDATAHEILHGRSRSAIGNMGDIDADRDVEQDTAHMRGGASAGRSVLHPCLVGFGVGDELAQRVGGEILARHQHLRILDEYGDRREVVDRVIWRLLGEQLAVGVGPAVAVEENVAVGCRLGDAARAGRSAGAADILDDDLLAEQFAHGLRQDPRNHIERAAGGEGHDHGNGAGRPILGIEGMKRRQHDHSERGGDEPCQHCLTLRFERFLRFLRFQRSFAVGSR